MPGKMIKVPYQGKQVDAEAVAVERGDEKWSRYVLTDGAAIRLKPVVLEVGRVPGEFDSDGNPVYVVRAKLVLDIGDAEQGEPDTEGK